MSQSPQTFLSSIKDDVWHDQTGEGAFECWTFDALSDDGRGAVSVSFYDNYVLSPRYFADPRVRFPAVTFVYSVDGKNIYHKMVEYAAESFNSDGEVAACSIGENKFRVDRAQYGSGYMVNLELATRGGRRFEVSMEWLSVEADLLEANDNTISSWNVVVPRSDVSGRITLIGRCGQAKSTFQFRGTGSHEHFRSNSSIIDTFATRQWGRAHFVDTTVFFCRQTLDVGEQIEKLYLVRDGQLSAYDAIFDKKKSLRSRYGAKYPQRLTISTDENISLHVKPIHTIESGFCNVKLLSEMTLTFADSKPRTTTGIAEFCTPKRMQNRLFRFLTGLGISRK